MNKCNERERSKKYLIERQGTLKHSFIQRNDGALFPFGKTINQKIFPFLLLPPFSLLSLSFLFSLTLPHHSPSPFLPRLIFLVPLKNHRHSFTEFASGRKVSNLSLCYPLLLPLLLFSRSFSPSSSPVVTLLPPLSPALTLLLTSFSNLLSLSPSFIPASFLHGIKKVHLQLHKSSQLFHSFLGTGRRRKNQSLKEEQKEDKHQTE